MHDDDFAWLVERSPEWYSGYAGKWIAVRDGQVVGVGATATEAAEHARDGADDADFLLEAIEADVDVIYECP